MAGVLFKKQWKMAALLLLFFFLILVVRNGIESEYELRYHSY